MQKSEQDQSVEIRDVDECSCYHCADIDKDEAYKQRKIIATSLASPIASFIAKFVTYPIDTIKTKIQADRVALKDLSNYKVGHSIELST